MKIKIIALGEKMPAWVNTGYQEYQKRLSGNIKLELIELPIAKRTKNSTTSKFLAQEAKTILAKINKSEHLVILDSQAKLINTEILATKLADWQQNSPNIDIIIGGPDGIDESIKRISQDKISFSKMTFPHPLVRIILAEQIYRAWTILQGHPYHK